VTKVSEGDRAADVARQLDYCSYCPKLCRHLCPVSVTTGRESLTPQAKMDRLNRLRRGLEPWTAETAEPIYGCTGCGHCTNACDHDNEPGVVLLAGRAAAEAHGAGHPALAGYPERFRAREARLTKQARDELGAGGGAAAPIALLPGCDTLDKRAGDAARGVQLLARIGLDAELSADVACAGYPLLAAGQPQAFREHATKVAGALARFRTIVVGCSACVHTMRTAYPAEGVPLAGEIVSLAEALARATALEPTGERRRIYYHDPCYLARSAKVIEEPRRVLGQLAEIVEFTASAEETECCGGAGLLPKTMPEVADGMARERLREVKARGGGVVVTSCGTCALMLRRNAPDGVEVCDLPEFVADALGIGGPEGLPPDPHDPH
jgi:Fe-S oxidoreductase